MGWQKIYEDQSVETLAPHLVHEWETKLLRAGRHYDDPTVLYPFAFRDLARDLTKHRLLLAHNMGLSKTRIAIAAADVRGCKHNLIVIPNKLMIEWERELRFLGFGEDYQIITRLDQISGYRCPGCDREVKTYQRVVDTKGNLLDVKRECPTCGVKARWYDKLKKFNLISMRSLWTIPADSPHAKRQTKLPELKDVYGKQVKQARTRMKYCFAWYLARRAENVIIDEAYSLGEEATIQNDAVKMLRPRRRTLLTGTPIKGYPNNILNLLNWCLGGGTDLFPDYDPHREGSRNKFMKMFQTTVERRRDDGSLYEKITPKIKNAGRFQKMLAPAMRRRVNLEPEVVESVDMPDFHIFPQEVEIDPLLEQIYNDRCENFVDWYNEQLVLARQRKAANQKATVAVSGIVLQTKLNYLAHLAACPQALVPEYQGHLSSKQAQILSIIKNAVARGRKVILYSEFVDSIEWYATQPALAAYKPTVITGTVSLSRSRKTGSSARDRRLESFREGDSKVLLASIKCVAEGFNIPEASVVIFDSYDWSPSLQQQAWSRTLRPAQKQRPVEIHLIGIRGTIDSFLSAQATLKRLAIGEGIDYEVTEFDADDLPDPAEYVRHLVEGSTLVRSAFTAEEWLRRLKKEDAEISDEDF